MYDIMFKNMMHGRYMPRNGDGGGESPRQKGPIPLPFKLKPYRREDRVVFNTFRGIASSTWCKDFTEHDRTITAALCTLMSQTKSELPKYEADQLPSVARKEYTAKYHDSLNKEDLEKAQAAVAALDAQAQQEEQHKRKKAKRKRILGRLAAGTALVAGISVVTLYGSHVAQEGAERQANLTNMAKSPDNLRSLGICALDMRMELDFDTRSHATTEEIRTDSMALNTALDAHLPCSDNPPQSHLLHYGAAYSGRPESAAVEREEFTSFVSANWPIQKTDLQYKIRHLAEEEGPDDYNLMISVGDSLYVAPQR